MTKYIIKVTYTEGIHKGKVFYLDKNGYVREHTDTIWSEDAYTLPACKAACTRKYKSNTAEAACEKAIRKNAISNNRLVSKYPLYEMKDYEPFPVETYNA